MNAEAILALLANLYSQLVAAQQECERLRAALAETQKPADETA